MNPFFSRSPLSLPVETFPPAFLPPPDIVFLPLSTRRSIVNFHPPFSPRRARTTSPPPPCSAYRFSREFRIAFTFPLCFLPGDQTDRTGRYRVSSLSSGGTDWPDKRFLLTTSVLLSTRRARSLRSVPESVSCSTYAVPNLQVASLYPGLYLVR